MTEEQDFPASAPTQLNTFLALELIRKNAIRMNTEVDARYTGVGIDGARLARPRATFTICGAKKLKDKVIFEGIDVRDGARQTFDHTDIIMIDGMDPVRFANNFGLDDNGVVIKQGKRRGRKPKNYVAEAE